MTQKMPRNSTNTAFLKKNWHLLFLVLCLSLSYLTQISLFTADLGRHIVNGKEILAGNTQLLTTNYFSFTQTDFPFINHHWFFGVIVATVEKLAGFSGLTILNLLINTSAFALVLAHTVKKYKQPLLSLFVGSLAVPLFVYRTEVRPESFSLLFFAVYLFLFSYFSTASFQAKSTTKKILYVLPILITQVLWTNIHLFFILGPLLAGYFLLETCIAQFSQRTSFKFFKAVGFWTVLTLVLFTSTALNPHGITGSLAPVTVFNNYAYRVAENQSSLFMFTYGANKIYFFYFMSLSIITFLFSVVLILTNKRNISKVIPQFILFTIFMLLGNKINRMSPFFGIIFISTSVYFIDFFLNSAIFKKIILNKLKPIFENKTQHLAENYITMLYSSIGITLALVILFSGIFLPNIQTLGVGLSAQSNTAAKFFIENNLTGPIFNNYDIGGYLVYHLYPQEKMFIDNRPEAYSGEFIENEYLSSLKNEEKWQEVSEKYKLNTIFFYRYDQMDGAQEFLYNRVVDKNWVPIYVDHMALIFVKNTEKNEKLIDTFALPNEIFGLSQN